MRSSPGYHFCTEIMAIYRGRSSRVAWPMT
jgi:hypothetical protein